MCLGVFSQMIQQITGINLITYYAATVYETSIGLSPFNSKILAACNGTEYFAASCVVAPLPAALSAELSWRARPLPPPHTHPLAPTAGSQSSSSTGSAAASSCSLARPAWQRRWRS